MQNFNRVYDFIFVNLYLPIIGAINKQENLKVSFIYVYKSVFANLRFYRGVKQKKLFHCVKNEESLALGSEFCTWLVCMEAILYTL